MKAPAADRRLFFLMHRATRALVARANARTFEQLGVSSAQLAALYYVAKHPGCSMTEVAELLDLNKSAMSATVFRLERAGHLRRQPHPRDGRATLLFMTPKGEEVRTRSLPIMRRLTAELTEGFTDDDMSVVFRFLNTVVDRYADEATENEP